MIRIEIEALQPIHLADSQDISSYSATLDYISGTALRGALATRYLQLPGNSPDKDFQFYFLNEKNWFGMLYPVGSDFRHDSYVIPLSAYSCKYHKGFLHSSQHGVKDLLRDYLDKSQVFHPKCENCGADLVPIHGYYTTLGEDSPTEWIQVSKRLITKSALDSRTETASAEQLYTREVIEEREKFLGFICIDCPDQLDFESVFIEEFLKEGEKFNIGEGKSRGFGLVEIHSVRHQAQWVASIQNDMNERLNSGNQFISQRITNPGDIWFTIDTLTDCIVRDRYLRFSNQLSPSILSKYLPNSFNDIELVYQFAGSKLVESWNALHNLPRPTEIAIQAGSVFVFKAKTMDDVKVKVLTDLEKWGIGERKTEGFGRVVVNHPFHFSEEVY